MVYLINFNFLVYFSISYFYFIFKFGIIMALLSRFIELIF